MVNRRAGGSLVALSSSVERSVEAISPNGFCSSGVVQRPRRAKHGESHKLSEGLLFTHGIIFIKMDRKLIQSVGPLESGQEKHFSAVGSDAICARSLLAPFCYLFVW